MDFMFIAFIVSFIKDRSKKLLMSSYHNLIIECSKNEKLQNYRINLSQRVINTNDTSK